MPNPRFLPAHLLLVLLPLLPTTAAPAQTPEPPDGGPPGWVLVDDMWVNPATEGQEGNLGGLLWPNGSVSYSYHSAISTEERALFKKALIEIEAISSLTFTEGIGIGNYIFVRRNPDSDNVSNSSVGMVFGPQNLRVGANHWDQKYLLAHEVFHALGFKHEQSRADRDTYVQIQWPFISPSACSGSCVGNFQIGSIATIGPYDFRSIMHYQDTAFTIVEGMPTIVCNPGFEAYQDIIGNRSNFSFGDADLIQSFYGQPSAPTITGVSPGLVQEGAPDITLTIGGNRFFEGSLNGSGVTGSRVTWNGAGLQTTWVSKTQLTAVVPAIFLDTAGTATIRVMNHAEAGGTSAGSFTFAILPSPCGTSLQRRGTSVAGVGDVNDDGVPDFVVGVPGFDAPAQNEAGRVELYFGGTGQQTPITFPFVASEFGDSLAAMADINGDGKSELIVGAPQAGISAGRFRVIALPSMAVLIDVASGTSLERLGAAVSDLGDIDGDGDREFLVTAPGANSDRGRVEIWSTNGGIQRTHQGLNASDQYGASVAGGLDVSDDGVPDYVVGAPRFTTAAGTAAGRIYVYSGATGNLLFSRDGDAANDNFGHSVALVRNTTSRGGTAHVVAGAPYGDTGGANVGYVRIFRGSQTFGSYGTVGTWSGGIVGDRFGWSVAAAGDPDDDGRAEIIVGATQAGFGSSGPVGGGRVEIISPGRNLVLHRERLVSIFGPTEIGSAFGTSVALVGDIDGNARLEYVVGQPKADTSCTDDGDFDVFEPPLPPALGRVLITEVSAGSPGSIELTNFADTSMSLADWRLVWNDTVSITSSALSLTLQPGERAIIKESSGTLAEAPPGTQIVSAFLSLASTNGDLTVALVSGTGFVVDEVRLAGSDGTYDDPGLGGKFRGHVRNVQSGTIVGFINAERKGGLDSNSGADWTASFGRSMGLENRNSGNSGSDPVPLTPFLINELDDSPDLLELRSLHSDLLDLRNWYVLASAGQNLAHAVITPDWDSGLLFGLLAANGLVILGEGSTPPAEKPAGIPYVNVNYNGGTGFPWTSSEFDCALYDSFGRLVDLVRTTGHDDTVLHNHPRAPSAPLDFSGAAPRTILGEQAIARRYLGDSGRGSDFRGASTRSMGSDNTPVFLVPSPLSPLDVRINSTSAGGGLTIIMNAGASHAGERWSFTFSYGHLSGTGPILGLGADALGNYQLLNVTPPWFGILDSRGSARVDFPTGTIPPGIDIDTIFLLQDPVSLGYTAITYILEFDS